MNPLLSDAMVWNVLIYHDTGLYYGSTEKLLQTIARHLDAERFRVHFLYGDKHTGAPRAHYLEGHVNLIRFEYDRRENHPPFEIRRMRPHILDVIESCRIDCVVLVLWANYLFPISVIPSTIPILAISPFGDWCTNGAVVRTYCSGMESLRRARRAGALNAVLFCNPSEGPPAHLAAKPAVGWPIVFGRVGRADDGIFDPIALRAFVLLEEQYGDAVRYDVVAAPPAMKAMALQLGARRVRFLEPLVDEQDLWTFYRDIDIFAHSRRDGETLGMAIAEAMLGGNPVISHKSHSHNDHLDLLHSSYARWVQPDDVDGYFAAMRWFVEHRDHIRTMGELAKAAALPRFGLRSVMATVERDIEEAARQCSYWKPFGRIRGRAVSRMRSLFAGNRFQVLATLRAVARSWPPLRRHVLRRRARAAKRELAHVPASEIE